jgi:hypothetical protein
MSSGILVQAIDLGLHVSPLSFSRKEETKGLDVANMLAASAASPTYKSPGKLVQSRTHYSLLSSIEKSKKCQPICARSLCCGIDDKKPGIVLNESIESLLFDKKKSRNLKMDGTLLV